MILAMRDIASRQLCFGRFDGSGTKWQRPHFAWRGIPPAQVSRLSAARLFRNFHFCGVNSSVFAWHELHSLRRVLSMPFAALRYDSLKAKPDNARRARASIPGSCNGAMRFRRTNNIVPANTRTSPPATTTATRLGRRWFTGAGYMRCRKPRRYPPVTQEFCLNEDHGRENIREGPGPAIRAYSRQ